MNLTLSNQYKSHKPHPFIQLSLPTRSPEKSLPVPHRKQCSGFFNSCMNGHEHLPSQQDQNARLDLRKEGEHGNQSTPKRTSSEQRKQKISVSLNHRSTQMSTPDRKKISRTPKHHSEQIKAKTEQATHSRIQLTTKPWKMKTEPKKDCRHREQSIHHIRQSTKPFQPSSSSKRQHDTRSKLTLSSAFKSQLRSQKKPSPQQFSSDHLLIQDSFMTAKLANIYGDRNSELQLFPKSNIVYYNRLMANEQVWKSPQRVQMNDVTFNYNEGKIDYKDVSIQKDIVEEGNEKEQEEEEGNFRAKMRERKWIGEYAKTIKTFNQSEMRSNQLNSQAESIVLEKGHNHFANRIFPITPVNRGSTKQYKQQVTPTPTRGYCSLNEEQPMNVTHGEHRFHKFVSQTIQEDLHDSQNNFQARQ